MTTARVSSQGETFTASQAAFAELREATREQGGDALWSELLSSVSLEARRACEASEQPTNELLATYAERLFVEVVHTADALAIRSITPIDSESTPPLFSTSALPVAPVSRGIGRIRADAVLAAEAQLIQGDPIQFLKVGSSFFYRDRANYGVTSLELTQKHAIVRFVFPGHLTVPYQGAPNHGPRIVLGYLERGIQVLAGRPQRGRYTGFAPRVDTRFGERLYNQHYEFDLDDDRKR